MHMNTTHSSIKYILLVFFIVLALVGVYYLGTQKNAPKSVPVSETQIPENQESSISEVPAKSNIQTYSNTKYGYTFEYPTGWEILGSSTDATIGITPTGNTLATIRVDVSNMIFDDRGVIPFTEYAKTAAKNEIQNYTKLSTIKEITTNSGAVGYETTWSVAPPPGAGGGTSVSGPMTYFPLSESYGTGSFSKRLLISMENTSTQYVNVYQTLITSLNLSN